MIAAPRFVGRDAVKGEALAGQSIENLARLRFMRAVADVDANRLGAEERFHHAAKGGHHAIECAGKTDPFAARPRKPGRGVRFPFRGHAETDLGRPFFDFRHLRRHSTRSEKVDEQSGEALRVWKSFAARKNHPFRRAALIEISV